MSKLPLKINNIVLLITTRHKISRYDSDSILLGFLSKEECVSLYCHHHSSANDRTTVADIVNLAGQHTLTIELLAKTAQSSYKSERDFLKILKEKDFDLTGISLESVDIEKDGINDYTRLSNSLSKVFDLSKLGYEERQLLLLLGCLDNSPLPVSKLAQWFSLSNLEFFNRVARSGWISLIGDNEFAVHQVVSSVLRHLCFSKDNELEPIRVDGIVERMGQDIEAPRREFKFINNYKYFNHIGNFIIHSNDGQPDYMRMMRKVLELRKLCEWFYFTMNHTAIEYYVRKTLELNQVLLKTNIFINKSFQLEAVLLGYSSESLKLQGRQSDAIPIIEKIISIKKILNAQPPDDLAICYTNLGQAYLDTRIAGNIPLAINSLELSLELKKACIKAGSRKTINVSDLHQSRQSFSRNW